MTRINNVNPLVGGSDKGIWRSTGALPGRMPLMTHVVDHLRRIWPPEVAAASSIGQS
jgi:hypothetical protein